MDQSKLFLRICKLPIAIIILVVSIICSDLASESPQQVTLEGGHPRGNWFGESPLAGFLPLPPASSEQGGKIDEGSEQSTQRKWVVAQGASIEYRKIPGGTSISWLDILELFPAAIKPVGGFSAVAVGPRVLLTAAHNGSSTKSGHWPIQVGTAREGCCDNHPDFSPPDGPDIALCWMNGDLGRRWYEHVDADGRSGYAGGSLLLTGFGTSIKEPGDRDMDLKKVCIFKELPSPQDPYWKVASLLLEGDSGGAAFFEPGPGNARVIVGVNAHDDIDSDKCGDLVSQSCTPNGPGCSEVTSTAVVGDWIEKWTKGKAPGQSCGLGATDRKISGVNEFEPPCNQGSSVPM